MHGGGRDGGMLIIVIIWSLMDNFTLPGPWHLILPGWHPLRCTIPLVIVIVPQSLCSSLHIEKTFLIFYPAFIHFSSTLEAMGYVNTSPEPFWGHGKMSCRAVSSLICLFTSYHWFYFTATVPSWCGIRAISNFSGFLNSTLEASIVPSSHSMTNLNGRYKTFYHLPPLETNQRDNIA